MGFWSGGGNVFTANVLSKVWDKNKEKVSERLAPRGGELGKAYRSIRGQTAGVAESWTGKAKDMGLDKPGGDVKKFTDWGRDVWHKGEVAWFGKRDQRNEGGNTAADDQALADLNYSSRRGFQGVGKGKKVGSEDMRREPYAMNTKTLLTQGQKAKKLTA